MRGYSLIEMFGPIGAEIVRMMQEGTRICLWCKKEFKPAQEKHFYCSHKYAARAIRKINKRVAKEKAKVLNENAP